ncbi:MAG: hypothetical protein IJ061_06475 [Lachnospiraceae bacterium]|nr:hypothetical protein [Lachnospiraceae bacterium]
MTAGTFERVTLYNSETGQQVELNGIQEISVAEEAIAEDLRKIVLDSDRKITATCRVTDQMALLRLKLMAKSWAGLVPKVRIRKAFWPWKGW